MGQSIKWMIGLGVMATLLGACGKEEKQPAPEATVMDRVTAGEPVTLKVWGGDNEQVFQEQMVEPIRRKYPNVTLEQIPLGGNTLEKLIASGNTPDIMKATKNFMIFQVIPQKMNYDMTPLIKKYGYDLGRYDADMIKSMQGFSDKGEMYALPHIKVVHSLLYNKQLFDRFGVTPPKDNMTWDEAIQLAARMTRVDGGVQYRGMDMQFYNMIASQLNLEVIDRSGKANMSAWTRPAELFKRLYSIPGNNVAIPGTIARVMDPFYKETLAMVVVNPGPMITASKEYPQLSWDLATVPTYQELPNTDPYMNYTFLGIAATSKLKDEAFRVIAHLNSDEVQIGFNRLATPTVLSDPAIQKQFAADIPELKGKNVEALFKHKQSDPYVSVYFDNTVDTLVRQKFNEIITGAKDNNTILRELDEAIEKNIADKKQAGQ
ncbi:ABC transporter substrate-binding protein [Paenibacillus hemerocallicola]|nr:extracellular solute-binding protein [Paenibacillus hemerocallicola]